MACGLPVVATDTGAISEMVREGRNGHLVAPRSPTELRAAIAHLLADTELRRRMGNASLAMARREHDARRNCHAILDLMHEVSTSVERAA
jgi:glycosyltransferase involved in cell wall biosynthesis